MISCYSLNYYKLYIVIPMITFLSHITDDYYFHQEETPELRAQSPEPRETTTKIEKNAITHHTKELTNTSSIYIVRVYILQV
jgi:hypothetical protein